MSNVARIGIVGGGFSGAMLLYNLVECAAVPLEIELFDEKEFPAQGVAYGTKHDVHLLNVPASRMGAVAGKPTHFFEWLQSIASPLKESSFAPRTLYAKYLADIFKQTLHLAKNKNVKVSIHHNTIVSAEKRNNQLSLKTKDQELLVDAIVLCTGNQSPKIFDFQKRLLGNRCYIADVWNSEEVESILESISAFDSKSNIVIIGTGLTTVDAVLMLNEHGYRGRVLAISRNGLLPTVHSSCNSYPQWSWLQQRQNAPKSAFGLVRELRSEVRKALDKGYDWRSVVDSLRPATQTIWQQLPVKEKQKFIRRLLSFWAVHRHRMAPEIGAAVSELKNAGRFETLAAKVLDIAPSESSTQPGLLVKFRSRHTQKEGELEADFVINCTGPDYRVANSANPLLRNLHQVGMVSEDVLGVGIKVNSNGTIGNSNLGIFAVGPLLFGELLETTAVPELREQAYLTATNVLNYLQQ